MTAKAIARTRRNVHIHRLYVRHEHDACLALIEEVLAEFDGLCEYPIYVKALVQRRRGRIQESLQLFQAATALNPHNVQNLKQVGRSLYLLGKHKAAVEVYEEAEKMAAEKRDDDGKEDWEIHHQKGLCYARSKQFGAAAECFMRANAVSRHEATYEQLGRVYQAQENWEAAIATYLEALESSPDSPDILATLGLLYLRLGETYRAFEYLDAALTRDPASPRVILAAGSVIQDHDDVDVALVKYRVAAVKEPNSAQLWNNVGMCFFGKNRFVAAIACLKKAPVPGPVRVDHLLQPGARALENAAARQRVPLPLGVRQAQTRLRRGVRLSGGGAGQAGRLGKRQAGVRAPSGSTPRTTSRGSTRPSRCATREIRKARGRCSRRTTSCGARWTRTGRWTRAKKSTNRGERCETRCTVLLSRVEESSRYIIATLVLIELCISIQP